MKQFLIALFMFSAANVATAQSSGFGYYFDVGGDYYSSPNGKYTQEIISTRHNGFVRFHSADTRNAIQVIIGHRTDYIRFQNYSNFLDADGQGMQYYGVDAEIDRSAWRLAIVDQIQLGKDKSRFCVSLNPGLYYEHTYDAYRSSTYDGIAYELQYEINPNTFGFTIGAELRFHWFTLGYKVERDFNSALNHNYIISRELNTYNSSELRGLNLSPLLHYIYLGVNLDFYE